MTTVRLKIPNRRPIIRVVAKWSDHKADLKIDFNECCAYCGSFDGYRHTYFEVDHFIPKDFFLPLGNITLTQYDNLVYSCKYCNRNKWNMWPSQSETFFHINDEGFANPCTPEYDDHLYRTADGAIMWKSKLGKWMYETAFKFDERERGIKLLWNLNRLRIIMDNLLAIRKQMHVDDPIYIDITEKVKGFALTFYEFHAELIQYYNE